RSSACASPAALQWMSDTMPNFTLLCSPAAAARSCGARGFCQSQNRATLAVVATGLISCPDCREVPMAIVLNHTIVPAHDKVASAEFFARIFGLEYRGPHSHFAPVQVNDGLTLDFDERG